MLPITSILPELDFEVQFQKFSFEDIKYLLITTANSELILLFRININTVV